MIQKGLLLLWYQSKLQFSEWLWCCLFYQVLSGWWFQTFTHFLLSIIYGMSSFPLTFIFCKIVKTTNHIYIYIHTYIYIYCVYIITHHISLYRKKLPMIYLIIGIMIAVFVAPWYFHGFRRIPMIFPWFSPIPSDCYTVHQSVPFQLTFPAAHL